MHAITASCSLKKSYANHVTGSGDYFHSVKKNQFSSSPPSIQYMCCMCSRCSSLKKMLNCAGWKNTVLVCARWGELTVHSWGWWLLAGMERPVDELIWNKYPSSISNRASQLLSAVVYSDRRCNFHICYCQAKWSSKWLSCKNRMTKTLCNYWTK